MVSLLEVSVLLFLIIQFVILFLPLLDHRFLLKPGAEKLESARKEFAAMEAACVIQQSNFGPALYSWFRNLIAPDCLNTQTVPDRYPIPNIADFISRLNGCMVFTKLEFISQLNSGMVFTKSDLTKGYY